MTTVKRHAGPAIRITYLADAPPNPVTGKRGTDAVERYVFFHNGREAVLTLSGPKGADNVDPWRIVTDSVRWSAMTPALEARSLYRFFHVGDDETLALQGVSLTRRAGRARGRDRSVRLGQVHAPVMPRGTRRAGRRDRRGRRRAAVAALRGGARAASARGTSACSTSRPTWSGTSRVDGERRTRAAARRRPTAPMPAATRCSS